MCVFMYCWKNALFMMSSLDMVSVNSDLHGQHNSVLLVVQWRIATWRLDVSIGLGKWRGPDRRYPRCDWTAVGPSPRTILSCIKCSNLHRWGLKFQSFHLQLLDVQVEASVGRECLLSKLLRNSELGLPVVEQWVLILESDYHSKYAQTLMLLQVFWMMRPELQMMTLRWSHCE